MYRPRSYPKRRVVDTPRPTQEYRETRCRSRTHLNPSETYRDKINIIFYGLYIKWQTFTCHVAVIPGRVARCWQWQWCEKSRKSRRVYLRDSGSSGRRDRGGTRGPMMGDLSMIRRYLDCGGPWGTPPYYPPSATEVASQLPSRFTLGYTLHGRVPDRNFSSHLP